MAGWLWLTAWLALTLPLAVALAGRSPVSTLIKAHLYLVVHKTLCENEQRDRNG